MKKTGSPQWRPPTCGSAVTSEQPRRHTSVSNTVTLSPRKGARLVQDVAGGALPANCANSPLSCILAVRRPRRHPPRLVRRPPRRPPATNTSCHAHPGVHSPRPRRAERFLVGRGHVGHSQPLDRFLFLCGPGPQPLPRSPAIGWPPLPLYITVPYLCVYVRWEPYSKNPCGAHGLGNESVSSISIGTSN